jgi:transcription elongation factor GreA
VILEEEGESNLITLGSVVTLENLKTGEQMEVQVVAPAEASVLERPMKVSDESPIGRALLGRKVGERLFLETPKGKTEFEVVAVHR